MEWAGTSRDTHKQLPSAMIRSHSGGVPARSESHLAVSDSPMHAMKVDTPGAGVLCAIRVDEARKMALVGRAEGQLVLDGLRGAHIGTRPLGLYP